MVTVSPVCAARSVGRKVLPLLAQHLDGLVHLRLADAHLRPLDGHGRQIRNANLGIDLESGAEFARPAWVRRRLAGSKRGYPATRRFCWLTASPKLFCRASPSTSCRTWPPYCCWTSLERHLAGTKAMHLTVACEALQAVLDLGLDLLRGQRYVQSPLEVAYFFYWACIGLFPLVVSCAKAWCERRDSNSHAFRRQNLNLVRLPIPPLSQWQHSI